VEDLVEVGEIDEVGGIEEGREMRTKNGGL